MPPLVRCVHQNWGAAPQVLGDLASDLWIRGHYHLKDDVKFPALGIANLPSFVNDPAILVEKGRVFAGEALPVASNTDLLARRAAPKYEGGSMHPIHGPTKGGFGDTLDGAKLVETRKMMREHSLALCIGLAREHFQPLPTTRFQRLKNSPKAADPIEER